MGPFAYYGGALAALSCIAAATRQSKGEKMDVEEQVFVEKSMAFEHFQTTYLRVYLLVMGADWLQGPYMYALYSSYALSKGDIGILFLVGFGSSMLFGPMAGLFADKFGRKRMCLVFCILYSLSCILLHTASMPALILGRTLSGIATAILFSAFESWMIKQHELNGFDEALRSSTFERATTGNGLVAIAAAMIATVLAESFGPSAPFKASFILLALAWYTIRSSWPENYGQATGGMLSSLKDAMYVLQTDALVLAIGIIQSLFESSMYLFVFLWAPALVETAPRDFHVLHGLVFASFMVCITLGSSVFGMLSSNLSLSPSQIILNTLFVSSTALAIPILTQSHTIRLLSFFAFEVCCGVYFPCLGTLRSTHVPDQYRSTIMTLFRIPLNVIVALVLSNIDILPEALIFGICSSSLALAAVICTSVVLK